MDSKAAKRTARSVLDVKGSRYELTSEMSRGGQGIVYHTHLPQVLVKGFTNKDESARRRWRIHIDWLIRQDLSDLKLARPLALLAEPRSGYVMELMDGLMPLQTLLDSFLEAEEGAAADYLAQGGLRRRIRILCQLARTLNQLHARGMLYGDLSPANIFVSDDPAYAETWLIDCDNISLEAHSGLTLHTIDYGAPEVVRGDALLSSLSDCWSFAVIAYQLLTHNHPFKGDLIEGLEPEEEEAALRGKYPWINDTNDPDNACFTNLPIQLVQHSRLPTLFHRCFEQGRDSSIERPVMSEWLEALTEIDENMIDCPACRGSSLMPYDQDDVDEATCFFCDEPVDSKLVVFEEFIFVPEQEQETHPELPSNWIKTGRRVLLQPEGSQELKRLMPSFSYDRWPSDHVCIEYIGKGMGIRPLPEGELHVQRGSAIKKLEKFQGLPETKRGLHDEPYQLHIGSLTESHVIWQFRW
ncbi:MAG: protein kinase [Motiliproteus sp.]|nr:protein kinase [Motiliproteus sp.]